MAECYRTPTFRIDGASGVGSKAGKGRRRDDAAQIVRPSAVPDRCRRAARRRGRRGRRPRRRGGRREDAGRRPRSTGRRAVLRPDRELRRLRRRLLLRLDRWRGRRVGLRRRGRRARTARDRRGVRRGERHRGLALRQRGDRRRVRRHRHRPAARAGRCVRERGHPRGVRSRPGGRPARLLDRPCGGRPPGRRRPRRQRVRGHPARRRRHLRARGVPDLRRPRRHRCGDLRGLPARLLPGVHGHRRQHGHPGAGGRAVHHGVLLGCLRTHPAPAPTSRPASPST